MVLSLRTVRRLWPLLLLLVAPVCHGQANPCSFSPPPGVYATPQNVTLSSSTSGAMLFYTTDGTTPTIASTQYTGPITVTSTTSINCIAAVPGVNRTNVQNQDPNGAGTYWKLPLCASYAAWVSTTAYTTGAHVSYGGFNYTAIANSTNQAPSSSPTFWSKIAFCAADDPGGTGVATAIQWTINNASPSLSGASMLFGSTSQTGLQTNVLMTPSSLFGVCDGCTHFLEVHDYYWPSSGNSSANEDDSAQFNSTDGNRFMAGMQYCFLGGGCPGGANGWDMAGNSNVPWTPTNVSAGGTKDVWHHFVKLFYRIPAEDTTLPCSAGGNFPYIYMPLLGIDGTFYNNGGAGWKYCANALPTGWASQVLMQQQIDIASHSPAQSSTVYWDRASFLATFDPSANALGTYTITASAVPPGVSGKAQIAGHAVIQ